MSDIADEVDRYIDLVIKLMDASFRYWPAMKQAVDTPDTLKKKEPNTPPSSSQGCMK
jgi:hypothetical protein